MAQSTKRTGGLLVKGNIYNTEFQKELDERGVEICLEDFPPFPVEYGSKLVGRECATYETRADQEHGDT